MLAFPSNGSLGWDTGFLLLVQWVLILLVLLLGLRHWVLASIARCAFPLFIGYPFVLIQLALRWLDRLPCMRDERPR
jgi:hypothetical protein